MKGIDNIFLYHLDYELQKLFGIEKKMRPEMIREEFMMVVKVAFLLCEQSLIIPASNYFESDYGFSLLNILNSSPSNGDVIKLTSSSFSIEEFLEKKKVEQGDNIDKEGYHYVDFIIPQKDIYIPGKMIKRKSSASLDIKAAMLSDAGRNSLERTIFEAFPGQYSASQLEKIIEDIPYQIGERAYLSSNVSPLFPHTKKMEVKLDNLINAGITGYYIESFIKEYFAACMTDIPGIDDSSILPRKKDYIYLSYTKYANMLRLRKYKGQRAYDYVKESDLDRLFVFKYSSFWQKIISDEEEQLQIQKKENKKEIEITTNERGVKGKKMSVKLTKEKVEKSIKVGISYAWENDEYKDKIVEFCAMLRKNGYDADMDRSRVQNETAIDFNEMASKLITESDKVIVFLSQKYKERADNFEGGVGDEYRIILKQIKSIPDKFIFVSYGGYDKVSSLIPSALGEREVISLDDSDAWRAPLFSKLSGKKMLDFGVVSETRTVPETRKL